MHAREIKPGLVLIGTFVTPVAVGALVLAPVCAGVVVVFAAGEVAAEEVTGGAFGQTTAAVAAAAAPL